MDDDATGSPPRAEAEPETQALRELQRARADAESTLARRLRMGQTDVAAMTQLAAARRPVGPTWLSARLGLTPAAATELVDRLEKCGHLVRERDATDRRRVNLIPSDTSLARMDDELRPLLAGVDELAEGFSADERAAILRFLREALAHYRSFTAAPGVGQPIG